VIGVQIHDGNSRESYDSTTLPYGVYINKSVVLKTLVKLEAVRFSQRIRGKHTIRFEFPELIPVDGQNLKKDQDCL
jgi:hypothetical protein